ncbi:MAG: hypothetical protein AABX47_05560 [Nanoarchaeota archaeon]
MIPQIGVMGSAADLRYGPELELAAERTGAELARLGCAVIFGAEKDYDSLPTISALAAKKIGGLTIGVTYGKGKEIYNDAATVVIPTGLERGGGREFTLVLSCDAIITIGGGSGTLTEIAIAYQAGIPIIALDRTGGWSDRLSGEYIDERKRMIVMTAKTPEEAARIAYGIAKKAMRKLERRKNP